MATLSNKRKLAAVTRETLEEHPRNGQSRKTSVARINEENITQVSEEIEDRVTKSLSEEFSRTESRVLGALFKLNEFLLNQQIRTHSGTVPGTFRNTNVENEGTIEDDSQSDPHPHPEEGIFRSQMTQNFGPEFARDFVTGVIEEVSRDMVTRATEETHVARDMVTGVQREIRYGHDMMTGATEETRNGHDMVTTHQEEIPYCSSENFLRKTKEGALHKSATISQ